MQIIAPAMFGIVLLLVAGLGWQGARLLSARQEAAGSEGAQASLARTWWWSVAAAGAVAAAATAAASLVASRRIADPLKSLQTAVEAQVDGDSHAPTPVVDVEEISDLIDVFARLNERHGERIEGMLRINNEQEAVLAGMAEGVLAIDADRRVISLNRSAGNLLGVGPAEIMGRALHEIVRNPELLRFVDQLLSTKKPLEQDIVFRQADERVLQVRGTLLANTQGLGFGAVFVLNDVSRLRRLENMRRDFAANVSHELKTPITSIKGFIETVLDGATPEDTERFLRIVARQADRLDAIIDDLLSLSRIEKEAEASDIVLATTRLKEIAYGAAHDCLLRADERGIKFDIQCADDAQARVNALLLQQAVRNLLENAVKYSDSGGCVVLSVETLPDEVRIAVIDRGCGIAPEHHARLFERFYRVDKARSRKLGGTGLGLAIVKHIVLAHRGRVTVESALGKGSKFTIHLPTRPFSIGSDAKRKTA
ncbi:MAG: PAS domain-containing sensor histidine kinase [Pirellula sp.]|nr:PAS domain-containing sensor histidine kinase [Pirellula sp.]